MVIYCRPNGTHYEEFSVTLPIALAHLRMRHWLPTAQDSAETCNDAAGLDMAKFVRYAERGKATKKEHHKSASYHVAPNMS